MSSREISELTGARHDNVMADIRGLMEQTHQGERRQRRTVSDP
ncbi:hypothetical protein FV217_16755 [Methylobacterium sp. WL9]|nr:hypothetical protein FV217_16755 [Methylobacterium sp. WL9]